MINQANPDQAVLPVASLVLVSYNNFSDLQRCLPSLYRDKPVGLQVILVDNGSEVATERQGISALESLYPGLQVKRCDENLGFAGGCNLGAGLAEAPILVFLNPDTQVDPHWLDALISPLRDDPRIGLTTARILLMREPQRINAAGNEIHVSGLTLCRGANQNDPALNLPSTVNAVSGAAFAIRRELFELLGGFDADFFMYMEDTDLSWRARLAGYTCRYVPQAVVYHDYELRFRPGKTFYQERNRYQTLLKNLHWASLLALTPSLTLAELVTWGYVLFRQPKQWRDKLRAYAWIVQHWREVMIKRSQVQRLRQSRDREILRQHTYRLEYEQADASTLASLAHWIFDPLFFLFHQLALLVIHW